MLETGIYVRVSTEEQATEGFSIRAQEEKLRDYSRIKEWPVYKIYMDEGISGKNITERPAINELIKDIEKGKVKNVLVYKIDRLTRSTADLICLIDLFNSHECAFNSLTESIDTQTATGRMFIKIIGIFAEFERENIAERSRLGFERKAREGYSLCTGCSSYGYDRKSGEKIQTINEYESNIVKEIFRMFIDNHMSYLDIARNLNSRNIKTKAGSIWHARTVKNALTNCNYMGNVRYASKDEKRSFETKGFHQPIISEELFNQTQELIKNLSIKSYTKRPKEDHYFSGILFCGKCGGKLVTHGSYRKDKDGNPKPDAGYRCRNYIKKTCKASTILHRRIENAFCDYINNIEDFNTASEIELAETENRKKQNQVYANSLHKQYETLERREKEILNLYIKGNVEFDNYIDIKKSIEDEKKHISFELENIEESEEEKEETIIKREDIIKNLRENWDFLNDMEKRQFLVNFVDKIVIVNELKTQRSGTVKIQDVIFNYS